VDPARRGNAHRIAIVTLVTLALSGAFVGGRLIRSHGNPSRFAFAGDKGIYTAEAPPSLYIYKNSGGFDGIIFYRLALDPFTHQRIVRGTTLDLPAFRFQRIVYPFLVHVVTNGDPPAVAWGLIAWNLAGMAALACLGARLAASSGRTPYWGFVFALAPPFALSLGLDTAEVLAGVFLFAGLLLLRRRQHSWATAALTLAALTRETTLVVCVAGLLVWLWKRVKKEPPEHPLWPFLIPGIVQIGWQVFLWRRWGHIPMSQGSSVDIGLPFRGFVRALRGWIPPTTGLDVLHLALAFAIVVFAYTVVRSVRSTTAPSHERAAWVLTALLLPFFQYGIWFHHWGFLRALSEFFVLGALIVLGDDEAPAHRLWFGIAVWASICTQLALYP
jgi:hypothetical protein